MNKWYEGSWYDAETVHDTIVEERHRAAKAMADDIERGNDGIASMAVYKELDTIIRYLDRKKPAADAPATDSDSATKQN